MKSKSKKRVSTLERRRSLIQSALPDVRRLVAKYDLAAVQSAVKVLYDERKADVALRAAEAKVAELRKRVGKK